MEPTKQGGDGPSDHDASNDPSSRQPPPSSLVEQIMPPPPNPPQLLQHQQQPYASHWTSTSSSSTNGPQPGAATEFSLWSHNAILNPLAWGRPSMPSCSANGSQPGVAPAFFLRDDNASLDPYASAGLPAPPAHLQDPQMIRNLPDPDFRAKLLDAPEHPGLVLMCPQVSARVVSMLDQGDKDLRVWVIQAVSRDVGNVMGSQLGSSVFLAMLRAIAAVGKELGEEQSQELSQEQSQELSEEQSQELSEEQLQELGIIVEAAASRRDRNLMSVANSEAGERSLRELFRVVAKNEGLCRKLFNCLVDEWRMGQSNGPELLQFLFTELGLGDFCLSIFVDRLDVPRFVRMVTSKFWWRCMLLCLLNEKGDAVQTEFPALNQAILNSTVGIAKSRYGNLFLQKILKSGGHTELKESIRRRLEEEDLQELSTHPFASYVVEACYVPHPKEPVLPLVQRGLDAFKDLSNTQLVQLARDSSASRVLCNLLRTGNDIEPRSAWSRTMNLARRIERLLAADPGNEFSRRVMEVLQEVLSVSSARTPPQRVQL